MVQTVAIFYIGTSSNCACTYMWITDFFACAVVCLQLYLSNIAEMLCIRVIGSFLLPTTTPLHSLSPSLPPSYSNLSEQTTLLVYLLLQGNPHIASFIFSRSDIDLLVRPPFLLYNCCLQLHNKFCLFLCLISCLSLSLYWQEMYIL